MISLLNQIPNWQKHIVCALFLLIVAYGIFFPALKYDFVADDEDLIIRRKEYLSDPGSLRDMFFKPFFVETRADILPYYRPMITLSYMMDYHIWGLQPFGFHLTNILIHCLNVLLIYWLLNELTRKISVSFSAALLFALHPMHIGSVAWISGRTDSVASIFMILTFICSLKFWENFESSSILRKIIFGGLTALFFFSGIFSKEISATLPLLFFAYIYFCRDKVKFKPASMLAVIFVGIFLFYWVARVKSLGVATSDLPTTYPLKHRLLTVPFLFFNYLKALSFPTKFSFLKLIDPASSILSVKFLIFFILLILFFFLIFSLRKSHSILSFALSWIFITLLPVLNIIPIASYYSEYWLYVPSIGFCLFLALGIYKILSEKEKFFWILIMLISLYYGIITLNSSYVFRSEFTLWKIAVEQEPDYTIAQNSLGVAYLKAGDLETAEKHFLKAIELSPYFGDPYANLATIYFRRNKYEKALKLIRRGAGYESLYETGDFQLVWGIAHYELGNYEKAIYRFNQSLTFAPNNPEAVRGLGLTYMKLGETDKGLKYLEDARNLRASQKADRIIWDWGGD